MNDEVVAQKKPALIGKAIFGQFLRCSSLTDPSGMCAHPSLELASNLAFQTINYLFDRAIYYFSKLEKIKNASI